MAFKMRTGTASEFGNGSNMSEGEIVNVKSGMTTENGGAMFYAPRDGVPERVVTDVDQTIESDLNFTGTISKNGTPLTPTAAEINRLSGVTDNIQTQINEANDDISALNQGLAPSSLSYTFTAGTNVSLRGTQAVYKSGNIIHIGVYFDATAQLSNNATICTVSGNLPKPVTAYVTAAVHGIPSTEGMIQIERGDLTKIKTWGVLPAATYYYAQFCYMAE